MCRSAKCRRRVPDRRRRSAGARRCRPRRWCAHGRPPPPGTPGLPRPRCRDRELMTCGRTGRPGLPLCHRSLESVAARAGCPVGEATACSCSRSRPVSRGVCPRRFGGLRDCGEDLLLRRPGRARRTAPELSRQGSLTTPTVPAGGLLAASDGCAGSRGWISRHSVHSTCQPDATLGNRPTTISAQSLTPLVVLRRRSGGRGVARSGPGDAQDTWAVAVHCLALDSVAARTSDLMNAAGIRYCC